jgi:site-specific recombinase XerD
MSRSRGENARASRLASDFAGLPLQLSAALCFRSARRDHKHGFLHAVLLDGNSPCDHDRVMASTQLELWSSSAPESAGQSLAKPRVNAPQAKTLTLQQAAARAHFYVEHARAARTRTAYAQDFRAFERWCCANGLCAFPASAETLVLYLTALVDSGKKLSTVKRARIAIGRVHAAACLPRPDHAEEVKELERGMGRVHGTKEEGAPPLLHAQLAQILSNMRAGTRDDRDRVLLLIGFWGAFRSSELVELRIEDVTVEPTRLRILVRRSKEEQLGRGEFVNIDASPHVELCAVHAVRRWIERVGQSSGPLLRQVVGRTISETAMQPRAVSRVVRRLARGASLGPNYSSHSLRAGLATSAFAQGVSEQEIQRHGRWKDRRSLDRYIRPVAFASRPNIVAAFR